MQTYTVHLPRNVDVSPDALERADLVKDGFAVFAFLFTFVWFLWHRLWLGALAVLVVVVGFAFALRALGVGPAAAGVAELLLCLLIGLEANALRRWTYVRRGRPVFDVVTARSRDEAEAKAIVRALSGPPRAETFGRALPPNPFRTEPVIGLFPDPEGSR